MKYLIIPENIYIVLLYGSIVTTFVALFMNIRGVIKKSERGYFIRWCIILSVALIAVGLTTEGITVANTMFGGVE